MRVCSAWMRDMPSQTNIRLTADEDRGRPEIGVLEETFKLYDVCDVVLCSLLLLRSTPSFLLRFI